MGHLFVLCGPPGSGKTTILKMIKDRNLPLVQLQRITTRQPRIEEGDEGKSNLEYEFLTHEEFAGRLSRGNTANFIEWNGNFYASELDVIESALQSESDFLLYEDIPSAVHLKHTFGSRITVLLLYTDDETELLKLEFAFLTRSQRDSVREWKRRLGRKYEEATLRRGGTLDDDEKTKYIDQKMTRAIPDLAFIAGKIRSSEDLRVLANRRDKQEDVIREFQNVSAEIKGIHHLTRESSGKFVFVLMPFKDEFNKLYRFVIKPAVERQGLTCLRGDEIFSRLNVVDDILSHIEASQLIISDISGGNPNVFLELGICMKMNKPIILISRDSDAPFNVRNCRWIRYEDTVGGWEKLYVEISDALNRVKKRESIVA
jgi:guanylate kinase